MKTNLYLSIFSICLLFISCSDDSGISLANGPAQSGQGGSMAQFTIANDHLFAVSDRQLRVFQLQDKENPVYISQHELGVDVETIFARDENTLFLGSTSGMLIYDISNAPQVNRLSTYQHIVSCDPVVADQNYAYVTLRSGEDRCARSLNQLEVIDIQDLRNPRQVYVQSMIRPKGLGLYGDTLLVCDNGVKIFDVSQPTQPQLLTADEDVEAVDIIPYGKLMIIRTEDGLAQYEFHNQKLTLLSEL